jgi:hypothetical protein
MKTKKKTTSTGCPRSPLTEAEEKALDACVAAEIPDAIQEDCLAGALLQPARDVTVSKLVRNITVPLPPDEEHDLVLKMKEIEDNIVSLKIKQKAEMDVLKDRLGEAKDRLYTGDFLDVQCEKTIDYNRNMVTVVRLDTGEIIEEQALTQLDLATEVPQKQIDLEKDLLASAGEDGDEFPIDGAEPDGDND